MMTIEKIITQAKSYLSDINEERVRRAFEFAEEAHGNQMRFSGEPYIVHPLEVAGNLLEFHPDEDSIIAALLHDVAEDTDCTIQDIEDVFGKNVSQLCHGLEKLSKVHSKLDDFQVENLRKLFLAMAKDFRVVLIKLCDRLHNMRTLHFVRPEKRIRISQETLNIYAPIAARLGIYRLKSQLEDLCFKYLHPAEYKNIQAQMAKTGRGRERYIDASKKILVDIFANEGIQARVDGRVKSAYSIYRKLKKKNKDSIDEIFDVFAMRVIVPDIYKYGKEYTGHLYAALGILHSNFTPLAQRFKDYVAVPKVNGYRSLHTTVVGLGPRNHIQPTEVQLRTQSMHDGSEFGIAAHWFYEEEMEDMGRMPPEFLRQHKEWISGLHRIEQEIKSNQELLESLQVDIFQDRILVLTPRGDVHDLPAGATPVDFAYAVHTEIGNHFIGAKVNGAMVPADHQLKSGEVVEIVTRKNAKPSQRWLEFAKTNHARNRVRAWFRVLNDDLHFQEGKRIINEKLKQLGKPALDVTLSIFKTYDGGEHAIKERRSLLVEVGQGILLPNTLLKKIFTLEELLQPHKAAKVLIKDETRASPAPASAQSGPGRTVEEKSEFVIGGEKNLPHHFVKCCSAKEADSLVGYVTRGRGVSLHKKTCSALRGIEKNRLLTVARLREEGASATYLVHIEVEAEDRVGLIRDIAHRIAADGVNIFDIYQVGAVNNITKLYFILEIVDFDQLDKVLSHLEKVPSVRRACKINPGSM